MSTSHNIGTKPLVSVVITTLGRPCVLKALTSVKAQRYVAVEIVVVVDTHEIDEQILTQLTAQADSLVQTDCRGGSYARNQGTQHATGDYICFLDDDDWWHPDKVRAQLERALASAAEGRPRVMAATATVFHQANGRKRLIPKRPLRDRSKVANYLVARRSLRHGDGYIQTSSLMVDKETSQRIPWDETLAKHQDWDFIIRCLAEDTVNFLWIDKPLVHVLQGSPGSISRNNTPTRSLHWMEKHRGSLSGRSFADFYVTHPVRAALAEGDFGPGLRLIMRSPTRNMPHSGAIAVLLSAAAGGMRKRLRGILLSAHRD